MVGFGRSKGVSCVVVSRCVAQLPLALHSSKSLVLPYFIQELHVDRHLDEVFVTGSFLADSW